MKNCLVTRFFQILFLLGAATATIVAQEVTVNEQGRRIVVYPDGTWSYFEEDSLRANDNRLYEPDALMVEERQAEIKIFQSEANRLLLELIQIRLQGAEKRLELDSLRQNKALVSTEKMILAEAQLSDVLKKEASLERQLESKKAKIQFYESMVYVPGEIRAKKIKEWEDEMADENAVGNADNQFLVKNKTDSSFVDVILNPPKPPCRFIYEGPDPQTGQQRRDLEPNLFFNYTAKDLETHFKYNDLVTCEANLTALTGGYQFLNLEIAIASKNAPQLFGLFPAGSLADLTLLDGSVIRVLNQRQDSGNWQPSRNAYIYKCSFPLGKKEEKMLRESEIDKIKLRWSRAEEEFEVYELDFFIRQFQCLD